MKSRYILIASLLALVMGSISAGAGFAAETTPIISTFAGNADPMSDEPYGDGGPATDANIVLPQDVAVDAAGNVFIADYFG